MKSIQHKPKQLYLEPSLVGHADLSSRKYTGLTEEVRRKFHEWQKRRGFKQYTYRDHSFEFNQSNNTNSL